MVFIQAFEASNIVSICFYVGFEPFQVLMFAEGVETLLMLQAPLLLRNFTRTCEIC